MPGPPFNPTGGPPSGVAPAFSSGVITTVPREWCVAGYARAHDRFKEASSQHPHEPDQVFIPLFEALNWAGGLEEDARRHTDDLLWAVRFVRNRVVHNWADAVKGRDISEPALLVVGPPVVWEWYWRDRASLPSGTNNRGGPAYDALLADKPVRDALEQLRAKF